MKLIDNQKRSKLGEGRNYQMGFAFCKRTKKDTYETVQPISPCKDYLNDVVFAEYTGKHISAYGLSYTKQDIFEKETAYMAISIMPYQHGGNYSTQEKDTKNLKENLENLVKFMNHFEEKLNIPLKTTVVEVADNKYLITFSEEWCKGTYKISLFSLLVRVGQFYKGTPDPEEYLKTFKDFPADTYLVNGMRTKLEKLLALGKLPEQNMSNLQGNSSTHNLGIVSYQLV